MNGGASIAEFERGLEQLGIATSEQEVLSMFEIFDQCGTLSKEFNCPYHTYCLTNVAVQDEFYDVMLKMVARSGSGYLMCMCMPCMVRLRTLTHCH